MKILFLGEYDSAEIILTPIKVGKELFKSFTDYGDEVCYISYYQDGRIYSKFKKYFGFEKINNNVYRIGIIPLIFFVIKFRPEIIHLITPALFYTVLIPLKMVMNFRIVVTLHAINLYVLPRFSDIHGYQLKRFKLIEKIAIRFSNLICVYNERDKKYISRYFNITKSKTAVLSNGISMMDIRKTNFSSGPKLKIAFVGDITRKEKGYVSLMQALAEINHPITLSVYNNESQKIKMHSADASIETKIFEPLNEREFRKQLAQNDLFIMPSLYESFGISLLEAMNSGLIILASSRVGLVERFEKELNDLVFNYKDQSDLINCIRKYLKMDNNDKTILSAKLVEFSKNYSWEIVSKEYKTLYNGTLNR